MNLLIDTHILLWFLMGDRRLHGRALDAIQSPNNDVRVSVVSAWEIAIKESIGRLRLPGPCRRWLPDQVRAARFGWLRPEPDDALFVSELPHHHRDPFDRMLIAQSMANQYPIVTDDRRFRAYDCKLV